MDASRLQEKVAEARRPPAGLRESASLSQRRRPTRDSSVQAGSGACLTDWRHASSEQLKALVLAVFHALVVRDGIHPEAAHQAFLVIDEYREIISPDIEGANTTSSNPR